MKILTIFKRPSRGLDTLCCILASLRSGVPPCTWLELRLPTTTFTAASSTGVSGCAKTGLLHSQTLDQRCG